MFDITYYALKPVSIPLKETTVFKIKLFYCNTATTTITKELATLLTASFIIYARFSVTSHFTIQIDVYMHNYYSICCGAKTIHFSQQKKQMKS